MKNLFKLLFTALLLVAFGPGAFAQSSASTTATVTSLLMTSLSITKDIDVAFGQIASVTIPTMAGNSATKTNVGSAATLGKFTVNVTAGSTVKLTYDANVELIHSAGVASGHLTFTPSVYRTILTAAVYGATAIASDGTYTANASSTNALAGTDHIFVGGTVTEFGTANSVPALGAGLTTGTYSGTFNITATYN
jgi:hypothetical protein